MNLLAEPGAAASRPRERRKAQRPSELLAAALGLFVRKGFAATRVEEVAAQAGVSKGTVYLYYASKQQLLREVVAQFLSADLAFIHARVQRHAGSAAALVADVLAPWWQELHDKPAAGLFKVVVAEARGDPELAAFCSRAIIEPIEQLFAVVLCKGMASGEFRPVDVAATVQLMSFPLFMLCLHRHSVGACLPRARQVDARAFIRDHLALMLRDLSPAPADRNNASCSAIGGAAGAHAP
jgi:AcrR family transcriptional regulator